MLAGVFNTIGRKRALHESSDSPLCYNGFELLGMNLNGNEPAKFFKETLQVAQPPSTVAARRQWIMSAMAKANAHAVASSARVVARRDVGSRPRHDRSVEPAASVKPKLAARDRFQFSGERAVGRDRAAPANAAWGANA